jgi:signal peptidase I
LTRTLANSWIPLAAASFAAAMVFFVTMVNASTPLIVLSGSSMVPNLYPGDLVILNRPHITGVQVNDIIAFTGAEETIVVHRVVEKGMDSMGQTYFITRGDSNQWNDKIVIDEHNYLGKVAHVVPKAGAYISNMQNPIVLALLGVTVAAFIMYQRRESHPASKRVERLISHSE